MKRESSILTTPIDKVWIYVVIPASLALVVALVDQADNQFEGYRFFQFLIAGAAVAAAVILLMHRLLAGAGPPEPEARIVGDPLQTERLPNGVRKLVRDLVVEVGEREYRVPGGAETDFSSIPFFGRFVVRWSQVDVAGVVHDWLYRTGEVDRRQADDIWYLCARSGESRANPLQAWVCWVSLRLAGGYAWRLARRVERAEPAEERLYALSRQQRWSRAE